MQIRLDPERWPDMVAGFLVQDEYRTDGVKLELGRDSWLLIRFDRIEGVLELVAEPPDSGQSDALLRAVREMMLI